MRDVFMLRDVAIDIGYELDSIGFSLSDICRTIINKSGEELLQIISDIAYNKLNITTDLSLSKHGFMGFEHLTKQNLVNILRYFVEDRWGVNTFNSVYALMYPYRIVTQINEPFGTEEENNILIGRLVRNHDFYDVYDGKRVFFKGFTSGDERFYFFKKQSKILERFSHNMDEYKIVLYDYTINYDIINYNNPNLDRCLTKTKFLEYSMSIDGYSLEML